MKTRRKRWLQIARIAAYSFVEKQRQTRQNLGEALNKLLWLNFETLFQWKLFTDNNLRKCFLVKSIESALPLNVAEVASREYALKAKECWRVACGEFENSALRVAWSADANVMRNSLGWNFKKLNVNLSESSTRMHNVCTFCLHVLRRMLLSRLWR